ncbi:MAG: hypothetical protein KDD55_10085 [Bdellovibrionales bacterium]|nr:hypothetical protein [Bdellovibrionales bacterium]
MNTPLSKEDAALKTFFLGPKAENAKWLRKLQQSLMLRWYQWRKDQYLEDSIEVTSRDQKDPLFQERTQQIQETLVELLDRFHDELPGFSPRYIGHMLSEISIPALLGHFATLLHNPNNISDEVSRVGLQIEQEALTALVEMVGYDTQTARGHFTSGGTVANIEGLVRARARLARWLALALLEKPAFKTEDIFRYAHLGWERYDDLASHHMEDSLREAHFLHSNPLQVANKLTKRFGNPYLGPVVLVPHSKHYSWPKSVLLLGLGAEAFWPIELDRFARLSVSDLKAKIQKAQKEKRPIAAVVSVAGTTELGDFDPVDEVQELLDTLRRKNGWHIWHHVDAAYGGFFKTLSDPADSPLSPRVCSALNAMKKTNSITIDPHKLGYVPYSSGTFLCAKKREYYITPFDAPYLRFDYDKERLPLTLEGSRSAGGAVATWMSVKTLGLKKDGYGYILKKTVEHRQKLEDELNSAHPSVRIAPHAETNICCFCIAKDEESLSESNKHTQSFYRNLSGECSSPPFYVSKTQLSKAAYGPYLNEFLSQWNAQMDCPELFLIRVTLMNPFFEGRYLEMFVNEVRMFAESV